MSDRYMSGREGELTLVCGAQPATLLSRVGSLVPLVGKAMAMKQA